MDYKQSPHLVEIFNFDILHLELNTPLYILGLVLVVMFFMNKWLFRPVLRTLDNRAALRASQREAAQSHGAELTRLTGEYEEHLANARAEVSRVHQESHQEARAEVTRILAEARNEAQQRFDDAIADLKRQTEQAKGELEAATRGLAEQISERLVNG